MDADYVTFTSSSTVKNFLEVTGGRMPERARMVSIGPVTSATAARCRHRAVTSRQGATTRKGWSRRCSPTPGIWPTGTRLCRWARSRSPSCPTTGTRTSSPGSAGGDRAARARSAGGRSDARNSRRRCPPRRPGAGGRRRPGGRGRPPRGRRPRRGVGAARRRAPRGRRLPRRPRQRAAGARRTRLGGVDEAVDVSATSLRLEPVAPTFHGRDVFAPVAAHLAAGRPLAAAGEAIDPGSLVGLDLPEPRRDGQRAASRHVLYVDRFGNLVLDARRPDDLGAEPGSSATIDSRGRARVSGGPWRDLRGRGAGGARRLRRLLGPARDRGRSWQRRRAARRRARRRAEADARVVSLRRAAPPPPASPTRPTTARASWRWPAPPSGTVVTADEQTAGRGRHGRRWSAPAGAALLCSAILRPLEAHHALLPLAVPLAVCEAAESLAPVECRVKWPNDVWLGERKLAGVLIEARPPDWAVIGVGLNLSIADDEFPDDLRWPATSLGHGVGVDQALAALREALGRWVAAGPDEVVAAFESRDALRGREIAWEGAGGVEAARGRAGRGHRRARQPDRGDRRGRAASAWAPARSACVSRPERRLSAEA